MFLWSILVCSRWKNCIRGYGVNVNPKESFSASHIGSSVEFFRALGETSLIKQIVLETHDSRSAQRQYSRGEDDKLTADLSSVRIAAIIDADYADDIAILANTPKQADTLLHSLERATAGIGLHVNAHKTEYMCDNQTGDISTLDGTSLKLVDKFTYLGSSVSSTKTDIDTQLTMAWIAIDKLSIIWKSDLTDKMKRGFFQAAVVSILL